MATELQQEHVKSLLDVFLTLPVISGTLQKTDECHVWWMQVIAIVKLADINDQ